MTSEGDEGEGVGKGMAAGTRVLPLGRAKGADMRRSVFRKDSSL
jgi:hypothetical protein